MAATITSSMPREAYDAIDALHYSTLRYMRRSPMCYRWNLDHPQAPTTSMILGNAAHKIILEPHLANDFAIWTGGRRFGKEWDAFCAANADKQLLTEKERDFVAGMAAAVRTSPAAKKYLRGGESEVSMVWDDPASKRKFKGRMDWLTLIDGKPVDVSLKSTRDCTPFRFGAQAFAMGYHIQDALYSDGYYYATGKLTRHVTIAVENKPPFETVVYTVGEDIIQQGKDDLSRLLVRLAECEKSGRWPADIEVETELSLPSYAYGDAGDDLSDLELVAIE